MDRNGPEYTGMIPEWTECDRNETGIPEETGTGISRNKPDRNDTEMDRNETGMRPEWTGMRFILQNTLM